MKNLANLPIKTEIERYGQRYVDKPVYVEVSDARPLSRLIAALLGRRIPLIQHLSHYEYQRLRWVKHGS